MKIMSVLRLLNSASCVRSLTGTLCVETSCVWEDLAGRCWCCRALTFYLKT